MGYLMLDGRYANTELVVLIPSQALPSGQTIGPVVEVGGRSGLRAVLATSAKSGTSPTLDVTLQTTDDPAKTDNWRTLGTAFAQQSDVGLAVSAVTSAGTTPPAITLSGTPTVDVNLRIECTTLGNRGTAVVRYSIDGGVTWTENVTTAATFAIGTTGLTANYANAAAAVDNVWTARTAGSETKDFAGLGRFIRAVARVGGSNTPIMTASLLADLV
jgi:hypothetical protein